MQTAINILPTSDKLDVSGNHDDASPVIGSVVLHRQQQHSYGVQQCVWKAAGRWCLARRALLELECHCRQRRRCSDAAFNAGRSLVLGWALPRLIPGHAAVSETLQRFTRERGPFICLGSFFSLLHLHSAQTLLRSMSGMLVAVSWAMSVWYIRRPPRRVSLQLHG